MFWHIYPFSYLVSCIFVNSCVRMLIFLPIVAPMAGNLLKVSSLAAAVFASSGFYLYNRPLNLNDLSVIRFGRAAATVSYCIPLP